jgi:hypothetical protein
MAEAIALQVWRKGHYALCPHLNAAFFDGEAHDDLWLAGGMEMLRRCDGVVLCPYWEESRGTLLEVQEAHRIGLPIYHRPDKLPDR